MPRTISGTALGTGIVLTIPGIDPGICGTGIGDIFMNKINEIRNLCEEKQIRMIDFKMTDIDGRWRHITIPVERFGENTFTYGIGFDGSNYGYAPIEKSDMVFLPDPDTAYVDPFAAVPTLTMCGNVCTSAKGRTGPLTSTRRMYP